MYTVGNYNIDDLSDYPNGYSSIEIKNLDYSDSLSTLFERLPESNVTSLTLEGNILGDKGVEALLEVLPRTRLTSLNYIQNSDGCKRTDPLIKVIPQTQLKEVCLMFCIVESEDIFDFLPESKLNILVFSRCSFDKKI